MPMASSMANCYRPGKMFRGGVARFKRSWFPILFFALMVGPISGCVGILAQQVRFESKRKIVVAVRPVYPLLARRANLNGVVRLRVTISPAGYPVGIEQLGGSPVLTKAATDAVSKAQWEPGPAETREIIQIRFEVSNSPIIPTDAAP